MLPAILQRVALPASGEGSCVELVLAIRDATYQWSLRLDSWTSVCAAAWYGIDGLRLLAELSSDTPDAVLLDRLSIVSDEDPLLVVISVVGDDGVECVARERKRALASAARVLLDRVDREPAEERLGG